MAFCCDVPVTLPYFDLKLSYLCNVYSVHLDKTVITVKSNKYFSDKGSANHNRVNECYA